MNDRHIHLPYERQIAYTTLEDERTAAKVLDFSPSKITDLALSAQIAKWTSQDVKAPTDITTCVLRVLRAERDLRASHS